jgi:hypothetical protein
MTHRADLGIAIGRTIVFLAALGCSAPSPAQPGDPAQVSREASSSAEAKQVSVEIRDDQTVTRIQSLTVGADGAQATYRDLRSTCGAFGLTMALTVSAADVSGCLDEAEQRHIAIELDQGRLVASRGSPDDAKAACIASVLGSGKLSGLTCSLEADVSR